MNLPSDPKERRRVTASMLQQKFGPKASQHRGVFIKDNLDEVEDERDEAVTGGDKSDKRVQYNELIQHKHVIGGNVIDKGHEFVGKKDSNSPTTATRQPRQWKQYTNQYSRQLKAKQPAGGSGGGGQTKYGNGRTSNSEIDQRQQQQREQSRGSNTTRLLCNVRGSSVNSGARTNKVAPLCTAEDDCELLSEVRRRLSLPGDTLVPESFLSKLNRQLACDQAASNKRFAEPLSRLTRRQSLYEIGFGKLTTYTKLHALGAGTYSIVYKGLSRLTNRLVALKEIHLEREEGVPFTAIREVSLLKQLKHNNIITLHDIICNERTLTLVFEFVNQDLSHYLDLHDHTINLHNARLFLFQLLRALKYCHDRKILHRDIKPQNILISELGELKLADFGLARAQTFPTKTYTDEVVTLWYRPPDILLGNVNYGADIDMWGVGCIFFEMVAGFTLFLGVDPKKQVGCIFEILGTPSEAEWPGLRQDLRHNAIDIPHRRGRDLATIAARLDETGIDLMKGFLKCNPNLRVTSNEALKHKYFSSLPSEIYDLRDSASIFSLAEVRLADEEFAPRASSLQNVNV